VIVQGGLFANGGGGNGVCNSQAQGGQESLSPALGAQCSAAVEGDGGSGGSALDGPTAGETIGPSSTVETAAGSGGGSAGYIRINTRSGTFVPAPSALISPSASVGKVSTR
jgi:hypothetical protein